MVPEKLQFGLKTWIWALVGNAPERHFQRGFDFKVLMSNRRFFEIVGFRIPKNHWKKLRFRFLWSPSLDRRNRSKEFRSFLKTKSKFVNVRNCCQDSLFLHATHLIQLVPLYRNNSSMLALLCLCHHHQAIRRQILLLTLPPLWQKQKQRNMNPSSKM